MQLCANCSQERQDREAKVKDAVEEEEILEELHNKAVGSSSVPITDWCWLTARRVGRTRYGQRTR
jgi:hypothetical protein